MSTPVQGASRVLVVEDDPHLAAGVMENLRAEGYQVAQASDGRAALGPVLREYVVSEAMAATSRDSASVIGGSRPGKRSASMVLPAPGSSANR